MSFIRQFRRAAYRTGSILGDAQAIGSGKPSKVAKRAVRKSAGRLFGRLMRKLVP